MKKNTYNSKMKCYTSQSWQAYLAGELPEPERMKMENHLLVCDQCLEHYMDLSTMDIVKTNGCELSEGFIEQVMAEIQKEEQRLKHKGEKHKSKNMNLLIGYCAAASIAMFFWVGGFFDGIIDSFDKGVNILYTSEIIEKEVKCAKFNLIQPGWTKKTMERQPFRLEDLNLQRSR